MDPMLFPALLGSLWLAATPIVGGSVDHPVDDRSFLEELKSATSALAENPSARLGRSQRLEQCRRESIGGLSLVAPRKVALGDEALYRHAAAAVVAIASAYKCGKCEKWHHLLASGFAVTADGVIATNHHVVAGDTTEAMGVMTHDGRFYPVMEILASNKSHDVALLRVDARDLACLPLREDATAGTAIRCFSHPALSFGFFSEGIIARYFKMNEAERNGAVFLQTTADYARGSSGGPLVDAFGNAVGMVASTSPVFASAPSEHAGEAKNSKAPTPSQQMVRRNCATGRALLELTRPR